MGGVWTDLALVHPAVDSNPLVDRFIGDGLRIGFTGGHDASGDRDHLSSEYRLHGSVILDKWLPCLHRIWCHSSRASGIAGRCWSSRSKLVLRWCHDVFLVIDGRQPQEAKC